MTGILFIIAACSGPQERHVVQSESLEMQLLHFWDNVNFQDTVTLFNPDVGEQQLVDFLALLPRVPDTVAGQAIQQMLAKAGAEDAAFNYYVELYRHYLADPNSPMRDDSYYESVLEYLIASPKTGEVDKARYSSLLGMLRLNPEGSVATDFTYLNANGQEDSLSTEAGAFTLLMFYDPTCEHCKAVFENLARIDGINTLLKQGKLRALAVSVVPDKALWTAHRPPVPDTWTIGLDEQGAVIGQSLYHIAAYPTLYLLDRGNRVLVKDGTLAQVLGTLFNEV